MTFEIPCPNEKNNISIFEYYLLLVTKIGGKKQKSNPQIFYFITATGHVILTIHNLWECILTKRKKKDSLSLKNSFILPIPKYQPSKEKML